LHYVGYLLLGVLDVRGVKLGRLKDLWKLGQVLLYGRGWWWYHHWWWRRWWRRLWHSGYILWWWRLDRVLLLLDAVHKFSISSDDSDLSPMLLVEIRIHVCKK
jgi:hypothetical protein